MYPLWRSLTKVCICVHYGRHALRFRNVLTIEVADEILYMYPLWRSRIKVNICIHYGGICIHSGGHRLRFIYVSPMDVTD